MKWNVWHIPTERWMSYKSLRSRKDAEGLMEVYSQPGPQGGYSLDEMEVRRVLPMMEQHGTQLAKLKPSMIWDCAMADLTRREHNRKADVSDMKPYAFHFHHVRKAESANDIIRAAIEDPARGQQSSKRDTRLLYSDVDLLKEALR